MIFNYIISRRCLYEEILKTKELVQNIIYSLKVDFNNFLTNTFNFIKELIPPALVILFLILILRLISKKNKQTK